MSQAFDVAVLGATGLVGQTMIELLAERGFPVNRLYPLASKRSAGTSISFKGEDVEVLDADTFDWSLVQFGFFSAGGSISAEFAPRAADAGCIVIDNTSEFRYEPDIPLVVPEVNAHVLADFRNRNIIANPNCSTIQMMVALKPIHDAVGIDRINVSTYQSVSGAGKEAMEELVKQTASLLNARELETKAFSRQIAFNVIPQIDAFQDNDYTKEEMKMVWETQKIMGDDSILVNATAVRVPVFYGHGEAIHLETRAPIDAEQVKQLLADAPGVKVYDAADQFPTQVSSASGNDMVHVGRIRNDITHPCGLNLWVVSDNIRKGAATNSIQIAETLIRDYL
ncbi:MULTISPECIES: aspartate-semialdehyde dehydrogenase [Alteromonas]|jgi:aspartate-semialdehyde dehydrogenase|uniref:Aspartate-semialdehyde dehydrogenase n=2 Tax=Alteromonas stellipolaris TaxID=233316 RepID=A0AAW7Z401_9ALTE|nr:MULTISPECIES: aspartate-semialdehyde dehydrogenase [Alteromonas]ALM90075.1 Aspartate-semialdehyde dehydrogenase [Alteromonas stellipolaris LMG 21856]AMJ74885.1 aspartate-semialdehyde dehydrogenase [Alteromonas stellipolaris]ANB21991.1 aspartate-semialdehyde dehydrogenase [Alteromonas stellipolaris]ANB24151.1 aspartate-semialdehyde dehydrogenase [Alteromonas stellipolaris]MBQ4830640.1 aspartate-semialdehyde dehydrogenase [Alteromonas sp. MMG017]